MCSTAQYHRCRTFWGSVQLACWLQECSERPDQSDCPWIECSFLYNKPSPKAFQRIWQYRDDHHLMLQHDNARPHVARVCTQFLEAENVMYMSPIEHVWDALDRYTTACSSSCQYPASSHSHWRRVDQHSTGHNQQPDQLYVKEMCCTACGKWWSHQILTGFRQKQKCCVYNFG